MKIIKFSKNIKKLFYEMSDVLTKLSVIIIIITKFGSYIFNLKKI